MHSELHTIYKSKTQAKLIQQKITNAVTMYKNHTMFSNIWHFMTLQITILIHVVHVMSVAAYCWPNPKALDQ